MGTHVPGKSLGPRTTSASRPRPGLALSGCHQTWSAQSVGSLPKRMAAVCGATAAQPRRVATNRRNQPPQNDQKRRAGMRTAGTRKQTIQQDNIKPCRSATPRPNDALRRGAGEQGVSPAALVSGTSGNIIRVEFKLFLYGTCYRPNPPPAEGEPNRERERAETRKRGVIQNSSTPHTLVLHPRSTAP